jgi:hypothetical protein
MQDLIAFKKELERTFFRPLKVARISDKADGGRKAAPVIHHPLTKTRGNGVILARGR